MLREQANQMYGLFPYFVTKSVMPEQILLLFQPILLLITVFWTIGYYNSV